MTTLQALLAEKKHQHAIIDLADEHGTPTDAQDWLAAESIDDNRPLMTAKTPGHFIMAMAYPHTEGTIYAVTLHEDNFTVGLHRSQPAATADNCTLCIQTPTAAEAMQMCGAIAATLG